MAPTSSDVPLPAYPIAAPAGSLLSQCPFPPSSWAGHRSRILIWTPPCLRIRSLHRRALVLRWADQCSWNPIWMSSCPRILPLQCRPPIQPHPPAGTLKKYPDPPPPDRRRVPRVDWAGHRLLRQALERSALHAGGGLVPLDGRPSGTHPQDFWPISPPPDESEATPPA